MSLNGRVGVGPAILIGWAAVWSARSATACSVCYGDPNSPMAHGVSAGVLVLLGVVGGVLLMTASLVLFWVRRAAKLEGAGREVGQASGAWAASSSG